MNNLSITPEQLQKTKEKTICVILAYNCANVLEDTYTRIPKDAVSRIVLIDDGSKDRTVEEAKRLGIEYYTHPNLGYGGNVKYSIRKCIEFGAENIIELHGDGQYDPTAIPRAVAKVAEGYDLVLGSRFFNLLQPLKDGMSFARYFANIGLTWTENLVLRSNVSEFHTGFRVYTKHLAETVLLDNTSNDFLFGFEVIAQTIYCKLKIGEISTRGDYRKEHTSISIPKSIKYAFQTYKVLGIYLLAKFGVKTKLFG